MTTREQRRANTKKYREHWYLKARAAQHELDERPDIPSHVAIDQARRLACGPITVTASLMGDPLPGYSALDRRA